MLEAKCKQLQKETMHKLQIPKRTRNNYKNGKQTNLQVPGTRKAVQKS